MLPIQSVYPELLTTLQQHDTVLIQAPPGAGKSTYLPLQLVRDKVFKRILLLEPRRLAARNIAYFLAQQQNEKLGQSIGLRMRNETLVGPNCHIEILTEAVLTRLLQNDPEINGVDCIIFDEFHERSLHADTALAFALESQAILRNDLRILIMSATLDSQNIAEKLNCPIISSEGRGYPIEIIYQPLSQDHLWRTALIDVVKQAVLKHTGDCLVFLPAIKDIHYLERELQHFAEQQQIELLPLHGRLPFEQQQKAIQPLPQARKIILSTNIAETSVTIDGVSIVVDSGKQRQAHYRPQNGTQQLLTRNISQASAIQRAGRAGRTSAGFAYRLGSKEHFARLEQHDSPEILRQDLSAFVLECKQWGTEISDLPLLNQPSEQQIQAAENMLQSLGAIDADTQLTELGKELLQLGGDLRINAMLIKAQTMEQEQPSILANGIALAALLESEAVSGDVQEALQAALAKPSYACKQALRVWQKRMALTLERGNQSVEYTDILLALAYPDRIAQKRGNSFLMANGSGIIDHKQQWLQHEFIAVAEVGGEQGNSLFSATASNSKRLQQYLPELFRNRTICEFNPQEKRFIHEQRLCLGKLIIERKTLQGGITAEQYQQAWLTLIQNHGLKLFTAYQQISCQQLHIRCQLAYQLFPEQFPPSNSGHLLTQLEQWFSPYLAGIRQFQALQAIDIEQALLNRLDWQQQQLLAEYFPSNLSVPSDFQRPIEYQLEGPAKLQVRIQEMFGCTETPSLAQGKLDLLIDLLSPAKRTLHLTQDLAHFWQNGYKEVQKEMKGRYPKHYWPDDPSKAEATTKTKRHLSKSD